jgi:hypothetical protein
LIKAAQVWSGLNPEGCGAEVLTVVGRIISSEAAIAPTTAIATKAGFEA